MPKHGLLHIDPYKDDHFCRPCKLGFRSAQQAISHCRNARVHAHEWCQHCEWLFDSPADLDQHFADSSEHHYCFGCDRDYDNDEDLGDHLESVHFECQHWDCEAILKSIEELEDHKVEYHGGGSQSGDSESSYHVCVDCGREFWSITDLDIHEEDEHFVCRECGDCLASSSALRDHKDRHHQDSEGASDRDNESSSSSEHSTTSGHRCYCPGCNLRYLSNPSLFRHLESGSCKSGVTWEDICRWASESLPSKHYMSCYPDYWLFRCPECDDEFKSLSRLLGHIEKEECELRIDKDIQKALNHIGGKITERRQ